MLLSKSSKFFVSSKHTVLVKQGKQRLVGTWLGLTAAGVFSIILVGGYTRLSGSGLSMTNWKPTIPTNEQSWNQQFQKYKKYPQFRLANQGMDLKGFKKIYFVQWLHRAIGLSLGAIFTVPLIYFLRKGYLQKGMKMRLLGLLGLGSIQGGVGWWMVKSGLQQKPDYQIKPKVSPYRLSMHLMTATFLYSILFYSSVQLLRKPIQVVQQAIPGIKRTRLVALITLKVLIISIFSGCIVAGIDAGKTYNTWPDMNGSFIPPGALKRQPVWKNFFQNSGLVQFNHRYLAYSTVVLSWILLKVSKNAPVLRVPVLIVLILIHCQLGLGITNVLNQSKLHTASAHQCIGFMSLTSLLYLLIRCKVKII